MSVLELQPSQKVIEQLEIDIREKTVEVLGQAALFDYDEEIS